MAESSNCICNICCEEITDPTHKVVLACNPKHIFCYDCIFEWYKKSIGSSTYSGSISYSVENGVNDRKCPICRKDGGFLKIPPNIVNQNKLPGIHMAKPVSYISSSAGIVCECISLNSYDLPYPCNYHSSYMVQAFDENYKAYTAKMCYHHYSLAKKGKPTKIKDADNLSGKEIYTIYHKIPCQIKLSTGSQCTGNCNLQKNGILNSISHGTYGEVYVCNKHKQDYDAGKKLSLFGAAADHPLFSFSKSVSATTTTTTTTGTVVDPIDLPEGSCGEKLKNGGYCKRMGKECYGGKCAAHKATSSMAGILSEGGDSKIESESIKIEEQKIDVNKFTNTWSMMESTLIALKDTLTKKKFESKIDEMKKILGEMYLSILSLKQDSNEENSKVCEMIEEDCGRFNELILQINDDKGYYGMEEMEVMETTSAINLLEEPRLKEPEPVSINLPQDHQFNLLMNTHHKKSGGGGIKEAKEAKEASAAPNPDPKAPRKTRYVLIDLFKLQTGPFCNVRLENGKLCQMPCGKYSNMKCSRHCNAHYNKEFFLDPEKDLYVRDLSAEELKKILENPPKKI